MRVTRLFLALAVALILVAPAAQASHWAAYYTLGIDYVGVTLEDDQARVNEPESPIDGRVNRVVIPGTTVGDGGLFLDARMGSAAQGTVIYSGFALDLAGSRSDVLLPGDQEVSAWYGWWLDINTDGVIKDIHDSECGASMCPEDEFKWRGRSTSEQLALAQFDPSTWWTGFKWSAELKDATDSATEQGWTGATGINLYGGLLQTAESVVVAGAPALAGHATGYDFDAPGVLVDVDRHEAVSPEVEALWFASLSVANAALALTNEVNRILADAEPITDPVWELEGVIFDQVITFSPVPFAYATLLTSFPKEPDTYWDDYEGRALFSGASASCNAESPFTPGCIGDRIGSYNDYGGYATSYHFWADSVPESTLCAGAFVSAPGVGDTTTRIVCEENNVDPVENAQGKPMMSWFLKPEAKLVLWRDRNGDGAVGKACNANDPATFDSDRNACKNPGRYPHEFGSGSASEFLEVCEVAVGRGTTFKVSPIGADWPEVLLVRDFKTPNRVAGGSEVRLLEGRETVELRWDDQCGPGFPVNFSARDGIMFSTVWNSIPIRIESTFSIHGFGDASLGISIGDEYVTDVDVLAAGL